VEKISSYVKITGLSISNTSGPRAAIIIRAYYASILI